MLKDVLKVIKRDGYIKRTQIASELGIGADMVDQSLDDLLRMGYLAEEGTGVDCVLICKTCPFAKNCGKEIVKSFKLSDKGARFLDAGSF